MTTRILIVFSLLLAACSTKAGERPSLRLTGNAKVDFFGSPVLLASGMGFGSDSIPPTQSYNSTGEEKSPWIAGALSLAVPGAGEVYTESYVKAAAFAVAEAASWIIAYSYNKKGDRQTNDYHAYADQHWSVVRYANWTLANLGRLRVESPPGQTEQTYGDYIYGEGNYTPGDQPLPEDFSPPYDDVHWAGLNSMERDVAAASLNGYTHQLPYYGQQQYYELIGKYDQFSRGWDDADISPEAPLNPHDPNELEIRSNSSRFYEYADMRAQSNYSYDIASTFVSVAVINHIVSALDAFWSATRFNSALHAGVKMRIQPTQFGYIPVTEARIKYDF